jgi:hypothetical protein
VTQEIDMVGWIEIEKLGSFELKVKTPSSLEIYSIGR